MNNRHPRPAYAAVSTRLWVVSELYHPERTSTGYFMTGLAEGIAATRPVHALCSQPTYSERGILAPTREMHNGVDIERCAGTRFDKDRLLLRVINLITISFSIAWKTLRRVRRGDLVLVVTNPPALPFLVYVAARARGARVALRIEDVYPEVLVAAGLSSPRSLVIRLVAAATRALYRRMERVIVLGRDMEELVGAKLGNRRDRMVTIPNWGDITEVRPTPRDTNPVLRRLGVEPCFVVQYMGNMGRTHGVDTLARAAVRLRTRADLHFLFIGWGARKAALESTVREESLSRVSVLPGCPREELSDHANACDLAVISFQRGMTGVSVPSRMYNVMAAGKPILAATAPDSELARVVKEERIGWVVPSDDVDALVGAIELAAATPPEERAEMGRRARAAVEARYSRERVISDYKALFAELDGPCT